MKKKIKNEKDLDQYLLWWNDFRMYLMEALTDGSSLSLIRKQFKERYTKRVARKSNRWFTATRMNLMFKDCMGSAWGREGLR